MRLSLVNTLWAQKGFVMLPAFLDALAEHYGAGVNLVDFTGATEAARQTINAWVAGQTEKRIQELLQPGVVDPETRLVLTNAIYFNAAWKTPFPETTQNAPFHRLDGSSVDVPTMRLTAQLPVAFGDGFGAVELPYDDDRLALLVVVPDAGRFSEIDGAFDGRRLEELVGTLQPRMAGVALPRWKSETPLRLDRVLADMGMPSAFGGGADLSGIDGHPDLFIQAVVHKAFIAVGEKGTEAAAASAVVVGRKAADPPPEVLVAADRPFLYVLRDRPTGAVLFLGRVLDPGRGPQ